MVDDFYLNLLSWSCLNTVAVALETSTYVWRADTGEVTQLGEAPEGAYISAVDFSNDGAYLGVGIGTGDVELWDVETGQKLRSMAGHQGQIAVLSWYQHILSSGCGDGSIWHHDVRMPRHKVMELMGHTGEVCGLKWRSDGELLASGGNDNVVNIWDARLGDVGEGARGTAKWTKRNHTAAVKVCDCMVPWQPSLLASGGGTNDATINVWNSTTGARLHTVQTPSQVTSILWAPAKKELLSTHGYPTNSIMVHAYPSMDRVAEIRDAHDSRVLFSAIGPAGDVVCTGAGDENLKFWRIWDNTDLRKKKRARTLATEGRTRRRRTLNKYNSFIMNCPVYPVTQGDKRKRSSMKYCYLNKLLLRNFAVQRVRRRSQDFKTDVVELWACVGPLNEDVQSYTKQGQILAAGQQHPTRAVRLKRFDMGNYIGNLVIHLSPCPRVLDMPSNCLLRPCTSIVEDGSPRFNTHD
ncbi:ubiquitin-protein transferase activating protein [Salix suchowensis]|nr:ubiquitin-protein transferase activating protein [Salix suchowensis]